MVKSGRPPGRSALTVAVALLGPGLAAVAAAPADISPVGLQRELTGAWRAIGALADPADPVDTLYFGWFDRPYHRATLACVIKTANALERELQLRRAGNSALRDEQIRSMLSWLVDALDRVRQPPRRHGFVPHRVLADAADTPAYGFVDRSTFSRLDDWYGDLDLLAACGFRAYARTRRPYMSAEAWDSLFLHADALRVDARMMGAVPRDASSGTTSASLPPRIRPLTLRELLEFDEDRAETPDLRWAVLDSAKSESWAESLARRGLYRGVMNRPLVTVCGWALPGVRRATTAPAAAVRAAMWAHACDGQQVALLEGWRDLRDGSLSTYPSLTTSPGFVETVAHNDRDLLFHRRVLNGPPAPARVVLLVDEGALDPSRPNRWSVAFARLVEELNPAHTPLDVLPASYASDRGRLRSYTLAMDVTEAIRGSAAAASSTSFRLYQRGRAIDDPRKPGEPMHAWLDRLLVRAGTGRYGRVANDAGRPPADVFARWTWQGDRVSRLALINLSERTRRVTAFAGPTRLAGAAVDVVSDTRIRDLADGVSLGPWQVRLFVFK